jgi:hypothetical protein
VQVLTYTLEGLAILIMLFAAFSMGSYVQRTKMLDEWRRVEAEWADLAREKARWLLHSRNESSSNGRRNR